MLRQFSYLATPRYLFCLEINPPTPTTLPGPLRACWRLNKRYPWHESGRVMMRFFGLIVLLLVGCADAAKIKYVSPAAGERIVVTAGYEARPKQPHVRGDEFVFSFVPPAEVAWEYVNSSFLGWFGRELYPTKAGYIILKNKSGRYAELNMSWNWIGSERIKYFLSKAKAETNLKAFPWNAGIKGDVGRRLYIVPDARSLRYGDWYRMGYLQRYFNEVIQRGAKQYYCLRGVSNISGALMWDAESRKSRILPKDAVWLVNYVCPFRTLDGRDGYWDLKSSFSISEKEMTAGVEPDQVLDQRLAAHDAWLEPMWQSLVITPLAYQFNPPAEAQQSVHCKSEGLCWDDIEKD